MDHNVYMFIIVEVHTEKQQRNARVIIRKTVNNVNEIRT